MMMTTANNERKCFQIIFCSSEEQITEILITIITIILSSPSCITLT